MYSGLPPVRSCSWATNSARGTSDEPALTIAFVSLSLTPLSAMRSTRPSRRSSVSSSSSGAAASSTSR
jgi:hypothetical protein